MTSRRMFIGSLGAAALARTPSSLKIGTMDGVFRMTRNPEAVAMAKKLGLASVQVTLGRSTAWPHSAARRSRAAGRVAEGFESARGSAHVDLYRHAALRLPEG